MMKMECSGRSSSRWKLEGSCHKTPTKTGTEVNRRNQRGCEVEFVLVIFNLNYFSNHYP